MPNERSVAENVFIISFLQQQRVNWEINRDHGFEEDSDFNFGERIALVHSELSEALESYRHGDPKSDKLPEFTGVEEELADAVIRIMNISQRMNLRIPEAMLAKQRYNDARPFKHGGKKF